MLFNSVSFLIFFPIVTIGFFLLPHKFRWQWLLAASCFFYMCFVPYYIVILAGTIVVDYFAGIQIEKTTGRKKKAWLYFSIITTCAILFVFKYYNFFTTNVNELAKALHWNYSIDTLKLILPIGLSFHTFQSLSYVIEVYRGNQKSEHHFGIYSLYVMFYPQLVAGPIERPQNLLWQFRKEHYFEYDRVKKGLFLILWGLFKKIAIADRVAPFVNSVYDNPQHYHGISIWIATFFFAIQIYCDFSGYSDIAIGTARVMGFDLMKNFNAPYFSLNISEFWRRWHISLSTWFKDYVYISLGGNRKGKARHALNLFITFMLSGLWHGAAWTFIIWGAFHGLGLVILIYTKKIRDKISSLMPAAFYNVLAGLFTFAFVCFGWIFFRAKNVHLALEIIKNGFKRGKFSELDSAAFTSYILLFVLVTCISLLVADYMGTKVEDKESVVLSRRPIVRWGIYIAIIAIIAIIGNFGNNQFIYFQF